MNRNDAKRKGHGVKLCNKNKPLPRFKRTLPKEKY